MISPSAATISVPPVEGRWRRFIGLNARRPRSLSSDREARTCHDLHLQTVLDQINLQTSKFDGLYATDPNVAARSTNDNLLDIVDIVQNDAI